MKKLSNKKKKELITLLGRPDNEIDLPDIPEIVDWSEAVVGKFYRPKSIGSTFEPRVARVKRRKR